MYSLIRYKSSVNSKSLITYLVVFDWFYYIWNFLLQVIVSSVLALALSRPQEPVAAVGQSGSTPIAIVNQDEEINPDGSFKFR